jgi:UDP-N-acetylmuramyl-tripeptide synthetase
MKLDALLDPIRGQCRIIRPEPSATSDDPASGAIRSDGPAISSIHYRAQEVRPGGLFVAIAGFQADGHDFIDQAIARGAAAVVVEKTESARPAVWLVQVPSTRRALAALACRFFGNPTGDLFVIAITGTNGKTTTSYLIENMLAEAGYQVGVIGTVNYRFAGRTVPASVTTPESLDLQCLLATMRNDGITHVVMEVSSHAIDLNRVEGCSFDIAVFTNLSQDHLDYHQDMRSYWRVKKRLFTELLVAGIHRQPPVAVVNACNRYGRQLRQQGHSATLAVGLTPQEEVYAQNVHFDLDGVRAQIITPSSTFEIRSDLAGRYNLENILCAVGAGCVMELAPDQMVAGLNASKEIPGRLERVPDANGRYIFVDYAHTPDALANVTRAVAQLTKGRLVCVFGCGGDRDRSKRPQMGRIAADHCDLAIVTSDNPRSEKPQKIIDEICRGFSDVDIQEYTPQALNTANGRKGYVVEADRQAAIELGVHVTRPGDVLLILGKGHESYQLIGNRKIDFDDRLVAAACLQHT